ncbi:hypothetical protein GCM10023324_34460 [Streptomyces youssoufiensis]
MGGAVERSRQVAGLRQRSVTRCELVGHGFGFPSWCAGGAGGAGAGCAASASGRRVLSYADADAGGGAVGRGVGPAAAGVRVGAVV